MQAVSTEDNCNDKNPSFFLPAKWDCTIIKPHSRFSNPRQLLPYQRTRELCGLYGFYLTEYLPPPGPSRWSILKCS
ncbi:hypothetical protein FKM82_003477 [Ascaphus truei]